MARYIHHYKTKSDFVKDYYNEDKYKSPWTSYVNRKGRWEPYPVNYNKSGDVTTPPRYLWIDDFKDPEEIARGYGYNTFEEYMDDYIADPESFGSNRYNFTDTVFEYSGKTYFLYEADINCSNNESIKYGLLPMSYSYEYLYEMSMEADYNNRFEPFVYILEEDEITPYIVAGDGHEYVAVKVETEE